MDTVTLPDAGTIRVTPPTSTPAQRGVRRTLRVVRGWGAVLLGAVVLLALLLGGAVVLRPWDSDVPPVAENPAFPDDVTVVSTSTPCGSGGCSREIVVEGRPDEAPRALAQRLGLSSEPTCHEQPGLTPRQVCATATPSGDRLEVQVRYADAMG